MTCTTYGKQPPLEAVSVVGQPVAIRFLSLYRGLACVFVSCRCRIVSIRNALVSIVIQIRYQELERTRYHR